MGIKEEEFWGPGAMVKSEHRSPAQKRISKESDSIYINKLFRPGADMWPSLVIEAGNSEYLVHLRADMKWGTEHSSRHVRIVLLVKVNKANQTLMILVHYG